MKPSYLKTLAGKTFPAGTRTPWVKREEVTVYLIWNLTRRRVYFHNLSTTCLGTVLGTDLSYVVEKLKMAGSA